MKKFAWILTLIVALSLVLSACGAPAATEAPAEATEAPATESAATEAATEAAPAEPFRVAVVMPSAINDLAVQPEHVRCPDAHSRRDGWT